MLHPEGGIRARDLVVSPPATLDLAVGPEGGFGESDLATLRTHGFRELALGPRILRTETAGIAAIASLQALHGDG
jgi:16S rRNA (uracil1498-N3)-methyltransferase